MTDSTARATRFPAIDALRGLAILAMIVYHGSWDLAYVGLVDWDVAGDPAWRGFAKAIACSFLMLVGVGLVLADGRGQDTRRFLWRLTKIAAGAAAVSLATWWMVRDGWVFFGILHLIAVSTILALPFLRAPVVLTVIAVLVVGALPNYVRSEAFDAPALWWTGLSATVPASNDYVPVFPWFGAVLAGVVVGRLLLDRLPAAPAERPSAPVRGLALLGRWSLAIYLVHQPLLFTAAVQLAAVLPPDPAVEQSRFARSCTAECAATAGGADYCPRFCGCVVTSMEGTGFWSVRGGDPEMSSLVATAAASCRSVETPDGLPDDAGAE